MKQTFVVTIQAKRQVPLPRVKDAVVVAANLEQDHPGSGEVVDVTVGTELTRERLPRDPCPECGEQLYTVQGLCHDRDGMRNNRWCEECKTMFATYAHGFDRRLVLKDAYAGQARERIVGLLSTALDELKAEWQAEQVVEKKEE